MGKPEIFISHSCKDSEIADGIHLDAETDPGRRRLKFAKEVRDRIEHMLAEHFTPLLDRSLLDPGNLWRTKLLQWLGICEGAVILLSEDSIESKWVLQEATICTWRKWLQGSFVLVPVRIGKLSRKTLEERGFAPLQIDEIQSARLDAADELNEANAESLAVKVVERFKGLTSTTGNNEIQRWVEDVAVRLMKIDEIILKRACGPLAIHDDDWAHFPGRPALIAHHLLVANLETARQALINIIPGFTDKAAFAALVELVLPIWVHAEAASGIAARSPSQADGFRAFSLNTLEFDTAKDYLKRAFCCPSWWNTRCLDFNEPLGEGQEDETFDRLYRHIATALHVPGRGRPDPKRFRYLVKALPLFVILGEQTLLTPELEALLAASEELNSITFLQLAGPQFDVAPISQTVIRLLPKILEDDEITAENEKILLRNLAS